MFQLQRKILNDGQNQSLSNISLNNFSIENKKIKVLNANKIFINFIIKTF
jgi:hypothetical protein